MSSILSAVEQFIPSLYADNAVNAVKMFCLPTLDRRLGVAAKVAVNDDECFAVKIDILKLSEQSLKCFDRLACVALAENRHFDIHGFHFLYNGLFRLCVVPRMTIADNGLIRPLIGFAFDLVATVAFDSFDKAISDTHDNAGVICRAVIVRVLKKYLVTDFGGLIKASCGFIILQREAAAGAVLASLALKVLSFVLVLTAKLIKAPVSKLVAPVKALLGTDGVTCFVQVA